MRGFRTAVVLVLGACVLVASGGCSSWFVKPVPGDGSFDPRGGPAPFAVPGADLPSTVPSASPSTDTTTVVTVSGRLLHIDDGKGLFWAIADDNASPLSSGTPPLSAVIANPKDQPVEEFVGLLVRVEGVSLHGAERVPGVLMLHVDKIQGLGTR